VGKMVEEGNFRVEKFNDQKFNLWKMKMEDYLYQKDLYIPLNIKSKNPTSMKDEEWDILDIKALGTLQLCLATMVDFNISSENTTKDLMKKLASLYEKPSASNKVFLMKHFFIMKMSEGGSITDHLNEFNKVTS
jgi:hypothetical protein